MHRGIKNVNKNLYEHSTKTTPPHPFSATKAEVFINYKYYHWNKTHKQ